MTEQQIYIFVFLLAVAGTSWLTIVFFIEWLKHLHWKRTPRRFWRAADQYHQYLKKGGT